MSGPREEMLSEMSHGAQADAKATADFRSPGPLEGVRVLDFTENMAGPYGTMILGDQGADVIKVEPPSGDVIRTRGTGRYGMSGYFANLNRNKRSLALDLHHPECGEVRERLLDWADVVVTSFRPAAARRLGIDGETVTRSRANVVHASIVGFGVNGPMAGLPVYDHVIQAISGIAARQADPATGQPDLVRQGVVDKATGHVLAESVCASLVRRSRSGLGCRLTISMLDVALSFFWPDGMMDHTVQEPDNVELPTAASFRLTPTADGHVALVVLTDAQWDGLIRALDLDRDGASPAQLLKQAREKLRQRSTAEVVEQLARHDVPCGPVVPLDHLHRHPQVQANDILFEPEHPVLGTIRQPRPVPRWSEIQGTSLRPAPCLGEHSLEILAELGLDYQLPERLAAAGALIAPQADRSAFTRDG